MRSTRTRLDRFIRAHTNIQRREVRSVLAQGRITVDAKPATGISQVIHPFSHVLLDNQVLQARTPSYVMLHKPPGVVCATTDERHTTVIDLLDRPDRSGLHLAGRLDLNSTGLVLLTNDGRWSRDLSHPQNGVTKRYRVTLEKTIGDDCIHAFTQGMYFDYEGVTTRPAQLRLIDPYTAEVSLIEGRYHQIKRMFGRFDNRVLRLHRIAIGNLVLSPELQPGDSRDLSANELRDLGGR